MQTLLAMSWILSSQFVGVQVDADREQIGEVQGKPVYRDQLKSTKPADLSRLFLRPLWEEYARQHQDKLQATPEEIGAFQKMLNQEQQDDLKKVRVQRKEVEQKLEQNNLTETQKLELKRKHQALTKQQKTLGDLLEDPPDRQFLTLYLNIWKTERHLYLNFGKGKVIHQQIGGYEALDARRNWMKKQKEEGAFRITDPQLSKELEDYYKNRDGVTVSEKGMDRFLNPDWLDASQQKPDQ